MKKHGHIFWTAIVVIFLVTGFLVAKKVEAPTIDNQNSGNNSQQSPATIQTPQSQATNQQGQIPSSQAVQTQTIDPLPNALSRITKKPFGIYITPATSPVQPERFQGYHTGVDLETTPAEQNVDVPVVALCNGKLLMARYASGYGGVAVESCTLDGQAVTIIYGHLRLSSVKPKVGDQLSAGDFLANLGTGYSSETDGERKHLHLGIHIGTGINILGYVQSKAALSGWLDGSKYLN